jgi:hypothetical protein
MAFEAKCAELKAAIAELDRLQAEAAKEAIFGGWTHEAEAAYEMRSARISALRRELDILDGTIKAR